MVISKLIVARFTAGRDEVEINRWVISQKMASLSLYVKFCHLHLKSAEADFREIWLTIWKLNCEIVSLRKPPNSEP
jgi:hypothetical protein